ncbi:MAG TPA: hypothetical protein VJ248_05980 [Candidatus Udaeobacter sp.]|nr:hypothetical protein [Candidatus Udaeobacter sp.]
MPKKNTAAATTICQRFMKYPLKKTIVTAVILACKSLYGDCSAGPADEISDGGGSKDFEPYSIRIGKFL